MKNLLTVLMAIVGIVLLTLSGCSNDSPFTKKDYSSEETTINNVILDVSDREIEVSVSSDDKVRIDYFENEKEYYIISETDGTLKMTLIYNKEWTDFIGAKADSAYRKIRLQIPDELLSNLTISTTNADIRISGLKVKDSVSLNSNGGNVEIDKLSAGKSINLTAKDGDITGSVLGGWDDYTIKVSIKKGDSNLTDKDGGKKTLNVNCNNGDIDVNLIK